MQRADHDLGIDEILGATEGDETDFDHREKRAVSVRENPPKAKTVPTRRNRFPKRHAGADLLLLSGGDPRLLALQVGGAAFAFDILVELLAHGVGESEGILSQTRLVESSAGAAISPERATAQGWEELASNSVSNFGRESDRS